MLPGIKQYSTIPVRNIRACRICSSVSSLCRSQTGCGTEILRTPDRIRYYLEIIMELFPRLISRLHTSSVPALRENGFLRSVHQVTCGINNRRRIQSTLPNGYSNQGQYYGRHIMFNSNSGITRIYSIDQSITHSIMFIVVVGQFVFSVSKVSGQKPTIHFFRNVSIPYHQK